MNVNGNPVLFKFGSRKHIDAFVQGKLYMNPLSYFLKKENPAQGDPNEGQAWWFQSSSSVLSIDGGDGSVPIGGLTGPIAFSNPDDHDANLFCMYALNSKKDAGHWVDPRNFEFGDTFVCLIDSGEFLRRVQAAAQSTGYTLKHRFVDYVDEETYSGKMGIFKKRSAFSYQNEFRFALVPGAGSPITLVVGDLTDLVVHGPLLELNQRIKIS